MKAPYSHRSLFMVHVPFSESVQQKSTFGNIAQYGNLALSITAKLLYSANFGVVRVISQA
jgi:hypothetical protein